MVPDQNKAAATEPNVIEGETPKAKRLSVKYWQDAISEQDTKFEPWRKSVGRLEDTIFQSSRLASDSREREMAIGWANFEVLKTAVYANPPIPAVSARFRDRKPMVRHGTEIMERAIKTSFDLDQIHETMKLVRDDMLIASRGVMWVVKKQNHHGNWIISFEHVDREDFYHSMGRSWKEVWWVGRAVYLTQDEIRERFGNEVAEKLEYQRQEEIDGEPEGDEKTRVFEVHNKDDRTIMFFTEDHDEFLEESEPETTLEGFFPCPRPAFGTLERRKLMPVPNLFFVKDQLEEINELTARISQLSESLRLKGFYAAGQEDVSRAIERAMADQDNRAVLVPIPATMFQSGMKVSDMILWIPVDMVTQVITALVALRKQLIEDVYEITGLSDIMRGATQASESATAQQLKAEFGSVRVRDLQGEMVRMARDAAAIAGEMIAEQFPPDQIMMMAQYEKIRPQKLIDLDIEKQKLSVEKAKADPKMMEQAQKNPEEAQKLLSQVSNAIKELQAEPSLEEMFSMLKDEKTRPYIIDIETDSTIQPDEDKNKQRVNEFLASLSSVLAQLGPMVEARPDMASFAGEVLKFAVSPYRVGRELDGAIDELVENMKQQVDKSDPAAEASKAEAQAKMAEAQAKLEEIKARTGEFQARAKTEQMRAQREAKVAEMNSAEILSRQDASRKVSEESTLKARKELADAEERAAKAAKENSDAMFAQQKAQKELEKTQAEIEKLRAEADKLRKETQVSVVPPMKPNGVNKAK